MSATHISHDANFRIEPPKCHAVDCWADAAPFSHPEVSLCLDHAIKAAAALNRYRQSINWVASEARKDRLRPRSVTPVVYYLHFGDRIKIGTTTNLFARCADLPHDDLLAVELGDREIEQKRHREWRNLQVNGEWFDATPELLAHAQRLRNSEHELPDRVKLVLARVRREVTIR